MSGPALFVDASVLIGLSGVGRLGLILDLPVEIRVVEAVWAEVAGPGRSNGTVGVISLREARTKNLILIVGDGDPSRFPDLDIGEASTLAAALSGGASVAVDERRARRAITKNRHLGSSIPAVIGTVTLVLLGKRRGVVESVQDVLDDLRS